MDDHRLLRAVLFVGSIGLALSGILLTVETVAHSGPGLDVVSSLGLAALGAVSAALALRRSSGPASSGTGAKPKSKQHN
jgi:hypothetical protein